MSGPNISITATSGRYVVRAGGAILGESKKALELIEGDYPAVIYFPRDDIAMEFLDASMTKTTCPHKGEASYFSIISKSGAIIDACWSYENPIANVAQIKGMLAFDPSKAAVEMV